MLGSHGLSGQRARRTKSRGPKGLQLENGAQKAPRLLVPIYLHLDLSARFCFKCILRLSLVEKHTHRGPIPLYNEFLFHAYNRDWERFCCNCWGSFVNVDIFTTSKNIVCKLSIISFIIFNRLTPWFEDLELFIFLDSIL